MHPFLALRDFDQTYPDEDYIVAGGLLSYELLCMAYRNGIFPWPCPEETSEILWQSPAERGLLFLNQVCWNKSHEKNWNSFLKDERLQITFNKNFSHVMQQCSDVARTGQTATWIKPDMFDAYLNLHQRGEAFSVEVWQETHTTAALVGGLYGVTVGGYFAGESMFSKIPGASRLALRALIDAIKSQHQQIKFIDIQQISPHMQQIGACSITRAAFLDLLPSPHLIAPQLQAGKFQK